MDVEEEADDRAQHQGAGEGVGDDGVAPVEEPGVPVDHEHVAAVQVVVVERRQPWRGRQAVAPLPERLAEGTHPVEAIGVHGRGGRPCDLERLVEPPRHLRRPHVGDAEREQLVDVGGQVDLHLPRTAPTTVVSRSINASPSCCSPSTGPPSGRSSQPAAASRAIGRRT